jgi:3',5'-cyclic AMP phosphodiesterase CpdA
MTRYPSRREVVLGLGAGLAGAATSPAWAAWAERKPEAFSFLVVSDTHLGRHDDKGAARRWEQTAREIDAAEGDFVLHLGDIVDGGREAQYAVYRATRERIRKPVHEIPGNHDPQELFAKHVRKEVDTAFDHKGVRFLLFNDSRRTSHDGFVSKAQREWLGRQCAEAERGGLFVVLATHVPVHTNRHPDRGWYVKPKDGQGELYALLKRHRARVLALLHGHFHNGIRGWADHGPLQEVVFPSALYNQDRKLAERKAPGFYLAELRPGFVRVTLGPEGMALRYQPVGADKAAETVRPLPQWRP